jgi:riboflavin transporter FmnP
MKIVCELKQLLSEPLCQALSELDVKNDTKTIAGTAILGTLVIVFDYSMKFSGLKIPFPWLPYLKFDFTGVPIVLSTLLFGLASGATTSVVAFLAILIRSGDVVGASMKALAEFSTILGMTLASKRFAKNTKLTKTASSFFGVASRSLTMFFANLIILPLYYRIPQTAAILISPLIVAFNVVQGFIGIILGYFLYETLIRRTSYLITRKKQALI